MISAIDDKETDVTEGTEGTEGAEASFETKQAGGKLVVAGDIVTEATAHLPEEDRLAIRWLHAWASDHEWPLWRTEKETGISKSTLYKVWSGKYVDKDGKQISTAGVTKEILRLKKLWTERASIERIGFVETSVFRQIAKICDECRLLQVLGFVYGESQIGKTTSGEEYTHRNNSGQTIFCRVPAKGSPTELINVLVDACNLPENLTTQEKLRRLKRFFDGSRLLILDEVHLFFETWSPGAVLRALEMIREIHDERKNGMVFFGTDVFRDEMKQGKFSRMLTQFQRRGIYELQLPSVAPKADVDAIAAAFKLSPAKGDALDAVKLIVHKDGLGKYCKLLTKASHVASKEKARLTWDHFLKVHAITAKMKVEHKSDWN